MTTEPKTYRKKPVEIEAMQWTGENADALEAWTGRDFVAFNRPTVGRLTGKTYTGYLWIEANGDDVNIQTGEWVAKDEHGFYPIKPGTFAATYEEVEQ